MEKHECRICGEHREHMVHVYKSWYCKECMPMERCLWEFMVLLSKVTDPVKLKRGLCAFIKGTSPKMEGRWRRS